MEDVRARSAVHPRALSTEPPVVIYDGDCTLCDRTIGFIRARSPAHTFVTVSRGSVEAASALADFPAAAAFDGVLLVDGGRLFVASDAALRIATYLRAPWPLVGALRIVPRPLRDAVYAVIARNRYRWFGRLPRGRATRR